MANSPNPVESQERADMRRWVETWKLAGPELAAIRRQEIRDADNFHVIELLSEAYDHAVTLPLRTTSGLVEMQRIFAKSPLMRRGAKASR